MRAPDNMTLISALLAKTPMWSADLFTLSLADTTVYRWTSADFDVSWSGMVWSSIGPAIQRSKWSSKNTTEVAEMEVQILSTGEDFATGNIKKLIHDGLFDGAYIQLDRAFMPTPGDTSLGIVTLFGGRVGRAEINALGAKITCVSANVLMAQNMPRNTFQLGCLHTLYDTGCTLNRTSFTDTYTFDYGNPTTVVSVESMGDGGRYVLGTLIVLDGLGAGQRRTVQAFDTVGGHAVACAYPLLQIPAHGDHFSLTQGCSKTQARCTEFGNLPNFRGFPHIPPASAGI
jgi:uncharacterized phage protein (TIGR02218 family)